MSIAIIVGDTVYGSEVTFYIGGTWEQRLNATISHICARDDIVDNLDFDKFSEEEIEWHNDEQVKNLTRTLLTKNIECFNDDLTKPSESYFYISVKDSDVWYEHFEYIAFGDRGPSLFKWHDLSTGQTGRSPMKR